MDAKTAEEIEALRAQVADLLERNAASELRAAKMREALEDTVRLGRISHKAETALRHDAGQTALEDLRRIAKNRIFFVRECERMMNERDEYMRKLIMARKYAARWKALAKGYRGNNSRIREVIRRAYSAKQAAA